MLGSALRNFTGSDIISTGLDVQCSEKWKDKCVRGFMANIRESSSDRLTSGFNSLWQETVRCSSRRERWKLQRDVFVGVTSGSRDVQDCFADEALGRFPRGGVFHHAPHEKFAEFFGAICTETVCTIQDGTACRHWYSNFGVSHDFAARCPAAKLGGCKLLKGTNPRTGK